VSRCDHKATKHEAGQATRFKHRLCGIDWRRGRRSKEMRAGRALIGSLQCADRDVPHGGCRSRRRRHHGRRHRPLTAPRRRRHCDRAATRHRCRGKASAATWRETAPPARHATAAGARSRRRRQSVAAVAVGATPGARRASPQRPCPDPARRPGGAPALRPTGPLRGHLGLPRAGPPLRT